MKLDQLIKTNFIASMMAFVATTFSSFSPAITATDQNIGLAVGAVTGLATVVGFQIKILEQVQSE